jgi:hypothetical protein
MSVGDRCKGCVDAVRTRKANRGILVNDLPLALHISDLKTDLALAEAWLKTEQRWRVLAILYTRMKQGGILSLTMLLQSSVRRSSEKRKAMCAHLNMKHL